ncbi:peptidylprolyl isomerase [Oculatella sp. LEGE 06141]|uniref:peptidylprolyl isomerase n=1 Tax=Oculatella sp. LEGE 06141 TaxID=1828648 RepID=UPI00187F422A|nr:peptidylprolyl isomerase [Oculatella sp. LEGE 06141]MBE9182321.1 peptidylprolyl isomerase [Oculatella sp. LEGE 06141]
MQIKFHRWLVSVLMVGVLWVSGCATPNTAQSPSGTTAATETVAASPTTEASNGFANLPRLAGEATVELVVNGSPITIQVNGEDAPITAGNFVDLVQRGVYNNTSFHRVVRSPQPFVVQGGDPQSTDPDVPVGLLGTGGFVDPATSEPRYIPLEIKPANATEPVYSQTLEGAGITEAPKLTHTRGAVAMARSNLPDSASSQFYITLADLSFLDGSYAVFGYVTDGMDTVDQIQQGDRIDSARVISGADALQGGGT